MINLAATALVAFSLCLIAFGVFDFWRARRTPRKFKALLPAGIGVLLLTGLLLLASPVGAGIFGALLPNFSWSQFAQTNLMILAAGAAGAALAVAVAYLARPRPLIVWGAAAVAGLMLLGGAYAFMRMNAQNAQNAAAAAALPLHPSLEQIKVPKGFRVQTFADNLQEPGALVFDDAGNLYYVEVVDGNVVRLRDTNGDGVADEKKVFASNFKNPRGLAWRDGMLYVSSRGPLDAENTANSVFIGQISTLRDTNGDGVADENKVILDGLFSLDIQHSNNGIVFGPDGKLYIAIGGPRVGQLELQDKTYRYQGQPRDEWQFAGVLQVDPDGKNPKMFARGLRNPYDLAFAADGALYASDNGDETVPVPDGEGDELNLIEQGKDYGYPYFFGMPPPWSGTEMPIVPFLAHASPTGVLVYDGSAFPQGYRGNILTALYWHGVPGINYRQIVRTFQDDKKEWKTRVFVEGLDRPTAMRLGPDGALYIADMRGGKSAYDFPGAIYRLSYQAR